MPTLITWNMQGSNAATDVKWVTNVQNMLTGGADILCLQECGAPPPSARVQQINLAANPNFTLYTWGGTSRVPPTYISYYFWDIAGNRVNFAIVTKAQPANHFCGYPNGGPVLRPYIGIGLNNVSYFCLHAISPTGVDAPGLLAEAAATATGAGAPWFVAGDFNRAAQGQPPLQPGTYCPPNGNTYPVSLHPTRCIDYMYRSANQAIQGVVLDVNTSDHYPVRYTI